MNYHFEIFKNRLKADLQSLNFLIASVVFKLFFKITNKSILTCVRTDGGGAQIHARFSVLAFANYLGIKFFNTPMREVQHFRYASGTGDLGTYDDWISNWNTTVQFENLKLENFADYSYLKTPSIKNLLITIIKICLTFRFNQKFIFELESAHKFTDFDPSIFQKNQKIFLKLFNPQKIDSSEPIVAHLRRADVSEKNMSNIIRFTTNKEFFNQIRGLLQNYPGEKIRIYTNEFIELPVDLKDVIVDHNSSPVQAFTHMVQSKVFLMAKSSLSYSAALLNQGVIYCPKFWHPKLDTWKSASELEKINSN